MILINKEYLLGQNKTNSGGIDPGVATMVILINLKKIRS